jgi:hypothetical protein
MKVKCGDMRPRHHSKSINLTPFFLFGGCLFFLGLNLLLELLLRPHFKGVLYLFLLIFDAGLDLDCLLLKLCQLLCHSGVLLRSL